MIVWCDTRFPEAAQRRLEVALGERLVMSPAPIRSNLEPSVAGPEVAEAQVALGQPSFATLKAMPRLRWAHLTSAGWARLDHPDVRALLVERGATVTTSSSVYAEPCAEQLLAAILHQSRLRGALGDRSWEAAAHRQRLGLLRRQRVVLLGFGAIARRLVELLGPFDVTLHAVRRSPSPNDPIPTRSWDGAAEILAEADHVVSTLPGGPSTEHCVDAAFLGRLPSACCFYNVGRGTTVDQVALVDALRGGHLAHAYLDVTDPEPLPPDHPLWDVPRCTITPHVAGGQPGEHLRLVEHFLDNLDRLDAGHPLVDRVLSPDD